MKTLLFCSLIGAYLLSATPLTTNYWAMDEIIIPSENEKSIYDFSMETIDGEKVSLSQYKGKVLIIVNVASQCGLTPQYVDIQEFYNQYKAKGVEILGFPANNFGAQEPGTNQEIKQFCKKNYEVTFPMFAKISVKGNDKHPLYQYLTKKDKNGVQDNEVSWNFEKFIIGKDGKVATSFEPKIKVTDEIFVQKIKSLL